MTRDSTLRTVLDLVLIRGGGSELFTAPPLLNTAGSRGAFLANFRSSADKRVIFFFQCSFLLVALDLGASPLWYSFSETLLPRLVSIIFFPVHFLCSSPMPGFLLKQNFLFFRPLESRTCLGSRRLFSFRCRSAETPIISLPPRSLLVGTPTGPDTPPIPSERQWPAISAIRFFLSMVP